MTRNTDELGIYSDFFFFSFFLPLIFFNRKPKGLEKCRMTMIQNVVISNSGIAGADMCSLLEQFEEGETLYIERKKINKKTF